MPTYNHYTQIGLLGGTITLTGGGAQSTIGDVGGGDNTAIFGDVEDDVLQREGFLTPDETYAGILKDASGEAVGFYTEQFDVLGLVSASHIYITPGTTVTGELEVVPYDNADSTTWWNSTDNTAYCFMAGTMIATPAGERAVETLAAGDVVTTASGESREVLWIGRQTIIAGMADPLSSHPVVIEAGALGEGVPNRDLHVSPSHALALDGVLVAAKALVNGSSIHRMQHPPKVFIYYHIELEDHALILANGAPAETFVDNVTREQFDNYQEWVAKFGEGTPITELSMPRAMAYRQLPRRIRALIEERAIVLRPAGDQVAA